MFSKNQIIIIWIEPNQKQLVNLQIYWFWREMTSTLELCDDTAHQKLQIMN